MSSRRETRPAEAKISKGETKSRNTHSGSQVHRGRVVGGILIVMASLWLGLLLLYHFGMGIVGLSSQPLPGLAPTTAPVSSLAAAGVSLGHPTRSPALTQQQALVIASQLEADAATKAKKTSAQYVLLNYTGTSTSTLHPDLNNVPAWMIIYQQIPLEYTDPSVDTTPFPQEHQDLDVFLDANTGKELLAIWL